MYISLDELPPLTEGYVQKKHQEALESKTLYEFKLIRQMPTDFLSYGMMATLFALTLWVGFGVADLPFFNVLIVLIFPAIVCFHAYYANDPDIEQTVRLTEKGIIVTEITLLPDFFYTFLRYSGFLGIGIGVVSVLILGPWALVGPGAGILIAFKMAGAENKPKVTICPLNSEITYKLRIAPGFKYKNDLNQRHFSPCITKEVDNLEREDAYCKQFHFYFLSFASSDNQQAEFMSHLEKIINIVELDEETIL